MDKKLRKGYTTGSCATAATQGALLMAIGGIIPEKARILTPRGVILDLKIEDAKMDIDFGSCAIMKDGGDDPDVTTGALIYATVRVWEGKKDKVVLKGGQGVGRVTKPGLACDVGMPAINPVPKSMILKEVEEVKRQFGFIGKIEVTICVPEGERLAKKTFNPNLGIEGGISILGTSGIVEPMSEKALIDTIKVEMNYRKAAGCKIIAITPGNYGWNFLKNSTEVKEDCSVKCSNFIGEALDFSKEMGFKKILLIGHLGKFIKLSGGIYNTNSKYGDHRMEIINKHLSCFTNNEELKNKIDECVMVDEAISVLEKEGYKEKVIQKTLDEIAKSVKERIGSDVEAGVIIFSNKYGLLGQSKNVVEIVNEMRG